MKIEVPDEIVIEGIARGVERAIGEGVRAEFRAFLEEYFGCMTVAETATMLGLSKRTTETLLAAGTLEKDTTLGARNVRVWLPSVKEALAKGRLKARAQKRVPKLTVMERSAA